MYVMQIYTSQSCQYVCTSTVLYCTVKPIFCFLHFRKVFNATLILRKEICPKENLKRLYIFFQKYLLYKGIIFHFLTELFLQPATALWPKIYRHIFNRLHIILRKPY